MSLEAKKGTGKAAKAMKEKVGPTLTAGGN